jgi:predicted SAM-dependent methyltransferase
MQKAKKQLKLNFGCGINKLEGYVNVDVEPSVKPDLIFDFTKQKLPYKTNTVDEIVLFHTIEHIQKKLHTPILSEFSRVLKIGAKLYISYPNFWECAQRWHDNKHGKRQFWEATLYGRQLFPSDYHICAIDSLELQQVMMSFGFGLIKHFPENHPNEFNTITVGVKVYNGYDKYEDLLAVDIEQTKINK